MGQSYPRMRALARQTRRLKEVAFPWSGVYFVPESLRRDPALQYRYGCAANARSGTSTPTNFSLCGTGQYVKLRLFACRIEHLNAAEYRLIKVNDKRKKLALVCADSSVRISARSSTCRLKSNACISLEFTELPGLAAK